jgi:hypothetical protein
MSPKVVGVLAEAGATSVSSMRWPLFRRGSFRGKPITGALVPFWGWGGDFGLPGQPFLPFK